MWSAYSESYGHHYYGNIRSHNKIVYYKDGRVRRWDDKIIKTVQNPISSYLQVLLWKNGRRKMKYLHRLVAETFIPNPENLPEVNHKDGNKSNNCVDNLEWVTHRDNQIHAYKKRLRHDSRRGVLINKDGGKIEFYSFLHASRILGRHQGYTSECVRYGREIYDKNGERYEIVLEVI